MVVSGRAPGLCFELQARPAAFPQENSALMAVPKCGLSIPVSAPAL